MSSKSKTKIYFWLKLDNNFYKNLAIKKARRLAGGDTMVIIYQKLMLESLQNNGVLYFEGVLENIVEELSLQLDEDIENVAMTLDLFTKSGLIQLNDSNDIEMLQVPALIDQETNWSKYKRDTRKKEDVKKLDNVQPLSNHCPTEIEIEIELNKDIDKDIDKDTDKDNSILLKLLESNGLMITPTLYQDIEHNISEFGHDLTKKAFEIAIEKCQRGSKAKYAYGILRNWKNEGVKTLEDIEQEDRSDWSWAEKKAGFKEV